MTAVTLQKPVRCKRCRRILKDPRSIKRGIGPECVEQVNLELDLMQQARATNAPGWLCATCGQPAPKLHKGQCPACFYGVTRLEDIDVIPFAEVEG